LPFLLVYIMEKYKLPQKTFCVYALINSLDGKEFYIGKGKKYRPKNHHHAALQGSQYHVHRKIRKIYRLGGDISVNILFETDQESEALAKEIEMIAIIGRENLTNHTDRGEGSSGFRHSPEIIKKLRQLKLGKPLSKESIQKRERTRKERGIPAWNKGKKMSQEFCKKVAKGGLGKIPWNKGKKMPPETCEKISRRQKEIGRKMTEYNKEQLKKAIKGVPKSEEHRRKLSLAHSLPVRCIETGEVFQSVLQAAEHVGVSDTAIYQAIKRNGRCKNYHWEKV